MTGFDLRHVAAAFDLTDAERILVARRRDLEEIRTHTCPGGICADIDAADAPELAARVDGLEAAIAAVRKNRAVA